MKTNKLSIVAHFLILAGVFVLAVWPLHPVVIAWGYHAAGTRILRRMQAEDAAPAVRYAQAAQAGEAFQNALAWDPLNHRAYVNLATVYMTWDDAASAARALARAVALAPRDAQLYLRLGYVYHALGEIDKATEAYTHVLALQPGNTTAAQALETLKATAP